MLFRSVNSDNYIPEIINIIKQKKIDVVLPIGEYEVKKIAQNRKIFDEMGVSIPISSWENISLATDKLRLQDHAEKNNIRYPKTFILSAENLENVYGCNFPVVLKQRSGTGQRGMKFFYNVSDFKLEVNRETIFKFEKSIIQEYVPGWDHKYMYTVGLIFDENGKCLTNVPLKKIRAQKFTGGTCTASWAVDEEDVKDFAYKVASSFEKWTGIINVELKRDPRSGELVLIEINPRPWGAMYGTIMAGVNFPEIWLNVALGNNSYSRISYNSFKPCAFFARDMRLFFDIFMNLLKKGKQREALSVLKTFKYPYLSNNRDYAEYPKTADLTLRDMKPLFYNIFRQLYKN